MRASRAAWLAVVAPLCSGGWAQKTPDAACVFLPPSFEDRVIYYNSFEGEGGLPEINKPNAEQVGQVSPTAGIRGRGIVGPPALELRSLAFSPHRPLTVSFWWALQQDGQPESNFVLVTLTNGHGFVQHFSRGKGDWCALQRPAAVLQVYYLPGIPNINGIYDGDLAAHMDLRAGVWHHCALTLNGGSLIRVYADGRETWRVRINGRRFAQQDDLRQLMLGNIWTDGLPVALDEVMVFDRALAEEEIRTYVTAVRQMAAVRYP